MNLRQGGGGHQAVSGLGAGFNSSTGFLNSSWPGQACAGGWTPDQQPHLGQLMDIVVGAVTRLHGMDEGTATKKKKKDEVDCKDVEEPLVPLVFDGLQGEDDGWSRIIWDIRTRLRPYVGSQAEFWARQPRVVRPLRECYDTSFLRMDPVNSQVTLFDHDRGASRTIKQYFKQNVRVERTKLSLGSADAEANDIGLRREYVESTKVYQVISGVWQYQSNLWMIRRDDHSGILILRILHDVKFFLPVLISKFPNKVTRDQKQLEVVNWFVDECLRQNSMRGRQGREPLGYEDALRIAKSSLHNIYAGSGVALSSDLDFDACSFDPYTAAASGGAKEVEVGGDGLSRSKGKKRGNKAAGGSGSGGVASSPAPSSGGSSGGPLPCRAWNAGSCTWQPCKFKHFCNKILPGGGFCKQIHRSKDH